MKSNIKFLDLKKINLRYENELIAACSRVIASGNYITSNELQTFENSFAKYCGTEFCVGVGNGLDALKLVLRAWKELGKLKSGDEVLVPSNTYIATILAITENSLIPKLVDPDLMTYNISIKEIKKSISSKTRVILPVHLFGQMAEMEEISKIANENNLLVLEDAAQAHGASINNKRAGSWGDAGAFSFYPTKNLGALGDGGAITTNDYDLYKTIIMLRSYGTLDRKNYLCQGVNSRLDEIQAAMLDVKIRFLDEEILIRQKMAQNYLSKINNTEIILPTLNDEKNHTWHLFVIRTSKRDALKKYLADLGIETMIHYPKAIFNQHAFKGNDFGFNPINGNLENEILSLPLNIGITEIEYQEIIKNINNFK